MFESLYLTLASNAIYFRAMNELEILEQGAIDAAINLDWKTAININKKILKGDKHNFAASLRLGFAYLQSHKLNLARQIYKQILKMQPNNQLAKENLERIKILAKKTSKKAVKKDVHFDPTLFMEIPGKTKSIPLVKLGQKNLLAHLFIGQEVFLKAKKRRIEVRSKTNDYIGSLPDDLSKSLFLFMRAGGEYSCFVKEASLNRVVVFIKEQKKAKKFAKYVSFPKSAQTSMLKIGMDEDLENIPEEPEEVSNDLENMAENLGNEDKEVLPYSLDIEDEENEEE